MIGSSSRRAIVLLTLCLPVVALADVAGTGTMQITQTDPYYARTGTDTFLPGTYEVLGHSLDLATLVGSVDFTAAAPTVFSLAHATFNFEAVAPMSGALALDGSGEIVCTPDCLSGTASFVGSVSSMSGSVKLPDAVYTFDGHADLGSGTGTFAINAFAPCMLPAGQNVTVGCSGEFLNVTPPGATENFSLDVTFDRVSPAGTLIVQGLSNAGATLPDGYTLVGSPPAFLELSTTQSTTGNANVCLIYLDLNHDGVEDTSSVPVDQLRLLYRASVTDPFVDVTNDDDAANNRVCGGVTSLGVFVLGAAPAGLGAVTPSTTTTLPSCVPACSAADPCAPEACVAGQCIPQPVTGIAGARCACNRSEPSACSGVSTLPAPITKATAHACGLLDHAGLVTGKARRSALKKAASAWKQAAAVAGRKKTAKRIGAACAAALHGEFGDAGNRARSAE